MAKRMGFMRAGATNKKVANQLKNGQMRAGSISSQIIRDEQPESKKTKVLNEYHELKKRAKEAGYEGESMKKADLEAFLTGKEEKTEVVSE